VLGGQLELEKQTSYRPGPVQAALPRKAEHNSSSHNTCCSRREGAHHAPLHGLTGNFCSRRWPEERGRGAGTHEWAKHLNLNEEEREDASRDLKQAASTASGQGAMQPA